MRPPETVLNYVGEQLRSEPLKLADVEALNRFLADCTNRTGSAWVGASAPKPPRPYTINRITGPGAHQIVIDEISKLLK